MSRAGGFQKVWAWLSGSSYSSLADMPVLARGTDLEILTMPSGKACATSERGRQRESLSRTKNKVSAQKHPLLLLLLLLVTVVQFQFASPLPRPP
jgi:hypothetical protein